SPLTVNDIPISNVGGQSCGECNIAEALKLSLNTSFYRMMLSLRNGPRSVADMAYKAGIPETLPGADRKSLEGEDGTVSNGIVLGEYEVRTLDMASALGTFATSGVYHEPYFVERVVTADGDVLLDRGPSEGQRVMDEEVADNVTAAMVPIAPFDGNGLAGGRPAAAKTGTAQLGDTGQNKDAWMVGYTPSLSVAVWMGNEDGGPLVNQWGGKIYGAGLPASIWKRTLDSALQGTSFESFPKPGSIGGQAGVPVQTTTQAPTSSAEADADDDLLPDVTLPELSDVEVLP